MLDGSEKVSCYACSQSRMTRTRRGVACGAMLRDAEGLADASRAYETYSQADAVGKKVRQGVLDATSAARRTSDALVACVADGTSADAQVGSTSADSERPIPDPPVRRARRTKKSNNSTRAWSVKCFHMACQASTPSTDATEGDDDEAAGVLVKPAGRRCVFLYVRCVDGTQTLVASAVLPTGVDAPTSGETMAVGPKAVRVVGEIENFVTEGGGGDLEEEDGGGGESEEDETSESETPTHTTTPETSTWWTWGARAAVRACDAKTDPTTEPTKTATATATKRATTKPTPSGWFVGWFGAETSATKTDADESWASNHNRPAGAVTTGASPHLGETHLGEDNAEFEPGTADPNPVRQKSARDASQRKPAPVVFAIPTPPPPPSLRSSPSLWAPRGRYGDGTSEIHKRNPPVAGSTTVLEDPEGSPYAVPDPSPDATESTRETNQAGFSYASAAEASIIGSARATEAPTDTEEDVPADVSVPAETAKATPGTDIKEKEKQEDTTTCSAGEVGRLEKPRRPRLRPVRLTSAEICEMENIRYRISELQGLLQLMSGTEG